MAHRAAWSIRVVLLAATVGSSGCCCCPTFSPRRMSGPRISLPAPSPPRIDLPDWEPSDEPPIPVAPAPSFRPYPQVAPAIAPPVAAPPMLPPPRPTAPRPNADLRLSWSLADDGRATVTVTNTGAVAHRFVLPGGGSVEGRREPRLSWHVYVVLSNGQSQLEGGRDRGALRDRVDWEWQDDVAVVAPGQTLELPAILPTGSYEISPSDRVRIELECWYGWIGPERSGRTDRGGMEGIEPFVLRAPPVTLSARAWLAAVERYRRAPRSRDPAHYAVQSESCVEVHIDGRLRGTTPLELDLPAGTYTRALRPCGSERARIGPLVLGPNDRVVERLSALDVAGMSSP